MERGIISLEELLTLEPEPDIPDDARMTITAAELRALVAFVRKFKESNE